jgi:hypothetical protein
LDLDMPTNPPGAGCAIVVEPGAEWPSAVFCGTTDRDCVVLVAQQADEPASEVAARLRRRAARLAQAGVAMGSGLLICAGLDGAGAADSRVELGCALLSIMPASASRLLTLACSDDRPGAADSLLAAAGALLEQGTRGELRIEVVIGTHADARVRDRSPTARHPVRPSPRWPPGPRTDSARPGRRAA